MIPTQQGITVVQRGGDKSMDNKLQCQLSAHQSRVTVDKGPTMKVNTENHQGKNTFIDYLYQ